MHRMLFEDVKLLCPDSEVHFAIPKAYHDAVIDHPFIDKVIDSDKKIDESQYAVSYVNDMNCSMYEEKIAPLSDKHRSDIWAEDSGFKLTRHKMHIRLTETEMDEGMSILSKYTKLVLIAPISTRTNMRALLGHQIVGLVQGIQERGMTPIGLHSNPIPEISNLGFPVLDKLNLRQLMSVVRFADYIVSIDTGTFHCAGGMNKPVLGIFTSADGEVYGKYYPKFELVQKHRNRDKDWTCGPCYRWPLCPKTEEPLKPCLTEITVEMMLKGFDRLTERFPTH